VRRLVLVNQSKPPSEADLTALMGGKSSSSRKRHLLVDTIGLLLNVVVHAAAIQDREGVKLWFQPIKGRIRRISLVWVNHGYTGRVGTWIKEHRGSLVVVVSHPRRARGMWVWPGWRFPQKCELSSSAHAAFVLCHEASWSSVPWPGPAAIAA